MAVDNNLWKNTKAADFPKVDDGPYAATLVNLELKETREKKEPMISWDFALPDGKHFFHNRVLRDENMLAWAKGDFIKLGIPQEVVDDFELLEQYFPKLIGSTIQIEIVTKGKYQNAYIQELLSPFDESEIPF